MDTLAERIITDSSATIRVLVPADTARAYRTQHAPMAERLLDVLCAVRWDRLGIEVQVYCERTLSDTLFRVHWRWRSRRDERVALERYFAFEVRQVMDMADMRMFWRYAAHEAARDLVDGILGFREAT